MLLPNVCWHPPNCYPPNKDATDLCYLLYGCANASLNKFPFAHAKSPTKFHRQSCYPPNQDATDLFYLLYGCANACLNKFPFAHTKTLSSSQLLPTNKDCACTPPEAELHNLRVLHCTCTVQNTMFLHPYIFISRKVQFCFWRRGGTFKNSAPCKTHSV